MSEKKPYGTANLRPCRTKSEAKKRGSVGGKKSGESRRAKKTLREAVKLLLTSKCTIDEFRATMKAFGITQRDMTNQMALAIAMFQEAIGGNVQAFNSLRDTAGEKPINVTEVSGKDGKPLVVEQERKLTMKQAAEVYAELNKRI